MGYGAARVGDGGTAPSELVGAAGTALMASVPTQHGHTALRTVSRSARARPFTAAPPAKEERALAWAELATEEAPWG